jgi:hypothetical protein
LVYFGYPRAHEDDAERAVRVGLGVIDAVGRLDVKSIKLQARIGAERAIPESQPAPQQLSIQVYGIR